MTNSKDYDIGNRVDIFLSPWTVVSATDFHSPVFLIYIFPRLDVISPKYSLQGNSVAPSSDVPCRIITAQKGKSEKSEFFGG